MRAKGSGPKGWSQRLFRGKLDEFGDVEGEGEIQYEP